MSDKKEAIKSIEIDDEIFETQRGRDIEIVRKQIEKNEINAVGSQLVDNISLKAIQQLTLKLIEYFDKSKKAFIECNKIKESLKSLNISVYEENFIMAEKELIILKIEANRAIKNGSDKSLYRDLRKTINEIKSENALTLLAISAIYIGWKFYTINKTAGYSLIPYIAWLFFATFLTSQTII
jgi:RNA binding exosome subunit